MSDYDRHLEYEEQFHKKEKKLYRKERKLLKNKDQSKYKKTDLDKKKNQSSKQRTSDLLTARILTISSEGIHAQVDDSQYLCSIKGKLKQERTKNKNLVAVGDFVHIQPIDDQHAVICEVEKRYSILSRAENYSRKKQQIIATNIDQVLITTSVFLPSFKPALIDRYVIMAQKGNMQPIVLINKWDYIEHPPGLIHKEDYEASIELIDLFIKGYEDLGILVIPISSKTGEGIDALKSVMKDKTSVFSGQSGVGKTSLINHITGLELRTSGIKQATQKGKHTTTHASLIPLHNGGYCVDTPGIKSFGLWDISLEKLPDFFPDFSPFTTDCAFVNCTHIHEPKCGVKEAVEEGDLSPLRYESYLTLYEDIKENHSLF